MVTAADTTQAVITTTMPGRAARASAISAGLAGAFLAGVLAATGAADYGIGLTRVGWDLARAAAISCAIVAVVAAMTWWGVEQLVRRLGPQLDRNRNATLEVAHRQEEVVTGVELAALTKELARMRGRLDVTLMEENELLHRLSRLLAADVGEAYKLGAQSRG